MGCAPDPAWYGRSMSRFTILLGGTLTVTARLRAQVAQTRVIAADSGIRHAEALGLVPELWIGDFDSVTEAELARHDAVLRETYPQDKDQTDGELALARAIALGASEIVMVGAFGGDRMDHAFLHLTMAMATSRPDLRVVLASGDSEGTPLLPGPNPFDLPDGTLFSILAFSDLEGFSIAGAKWPLDGVQVPFGSSLTLSNVSRGKLSVTLGRGRAMLVAQFPRPSDA